MKEKELKVEVEKRFDVNHPNHHAACDLPNPVSLKFID